MKNERSIQAMALCAAMALPGMAAPSRNMVTAQQIADTLNDAGMKICAQQVTLLADVVASTSKPRLRVASMERWGDHRVKVRLDCASNAECIPFLVAVNLNSGDAIPAALNSSTAASRSASGPKSLAVRAGEPATLFLDGDHVHIQLTVTCLENGVPGQTVRVVSNDKRRTFSAQVFSEAVLKGKL
jgi:hypothetical protein